MATPFSFQEETKSNSYVFEVDQVNDWYPHGFDKYSKPQDHVQGSLPDRPTSLYDVQKMGLVMACYKAYSAHIKLVLRPDDFWMAITQGFGQYINLNAEKVRKQFVAHDGKKALSVAIATPDFSVVPMMMREQIKANIKDDQVIDWLLPQFSTTTPDDQVAYCISIMSSFQKYFDYGCVLMCGLPSVTLMGNVADWEVLAKRVASLAEFDGGHGILKHWSEELAPIMQKLVESRRVKPDLNWWRTIANISGGSGPTYLNGWISKFVLYTNQNELRGQRIEFQHVPAGMMTVPLKVVDWSGTEHQTVLHAGSSMVEIRGSKANAVIRPVIDWFMIAEKPMQDLVKSYKARTNVPIKRKAEDELVQV
jgi:hypothetical protein